MTDFKIEIILICQHKKVFRVSIKMKQFYYQKDLMKLICNKISNVINLKKKINTDHLRLIFINHKIILN